MGLSNELSCEAGSFFHCCLNPHRCFQSEALRLYFPCWSPGLCGLSRSPVVPPGLPARECGTTQSASHHLATSSLSSCPSPPLLLVWMIVFSLTPWLSNFHTVQFSVSSGCFLFLNLLLPFFWLCKEAQCIYLHLHLGWK